MALRYIIGEYANEARRYGARQPVVAIAAGVIGFLVVARLTLFCVWLLFFAPAALRELRGRITCGGEPIDEGNVALEPLAATRIASRTAHVTSGTFVLGKANGVVPDVEYLVRVEGFRKTGRTYPGVNPGEFSEEYEQLVLPEFNRDSRMRIRMTRDVLRNGLHIDVQGRPAPEAKKR